MPSPESSRRNLEKARARWRPPRAWRSATETLLIRCICWQWYTCRGVRPTERALAREIGCSYTWVQKLVREFSGTGRMLVEMPRLTFWQALVKLREEQERSQEMRERGLLRSRFIRGATE